MTAAMASVIKPRAIPDLKHNSHRDVAASTTANGKHSSPSPAGSRFLGTPTASSSPRPVGPTISRKSTAQSTASGFGAPPGPGAFGDDRVAASPPERRPATPPSTITGTRPAPPSSRLSRSNTSATTTVHHREKDQDTAEIRESDGKHADEAAQKDSSTATGIGPGSSANTRANTLPISPSAASTPAIDPLSQHIFLRTNEAIPQRLRNTAKPDSSSNVAEGFARLSADLLPTRNLAPAGDASKDKRKGPSFLSRLSMRGSKKHDGGDFDTDSELGSEVRMDGINARVFSQTATINSLGGGGYIPHHKEPPRYIRTKSHGKKNREFNRVFLAQELVGTRPPKTDKTDSGGNGGAGATETGKNPVVTVSGAGQNGRKVVRTGGAVWATEFSKDGKYLAAGGRDNVVRIWAVISTPEERKAYEEEENANGGTGERLSAPVFRDQPIREFEGHTGEVLDLSWSKNNFLLSSSMDKTVRLWHISRNECLCTFKHKDFVTRLAFHPRDDRFFLAGSLDTMLRLWSIPDKAVAFSAQLPDLVTAVAFSPDGKTAIAGLRTGLCLFYETEGLTLQTQLHVRSSRGKNAKGSKITGIQTMAIPPANSPGHLSSARPNSAAVSHSSLDFAAQGEVKVLITSNDSRVRIYSLREKALDIKLKGHDNACSQIAATFSDDGKYVICGSEDRKAFIWSLSGDDQGMSLDKDKSPCEYFEAHGGIVTTALFAPTTTRMLLGQSGDPIYDLCNPPPVMLRSLEEAASIAASQTDLGTEDMHHHSETAAKKPELSPAYLARSTHYDGHILVTTDDTGIIKVFRQDCAYLKRRQEAWESGSAFSRKLTGHGTSFASGGLGRSVSVLTRTSAGTSAHSRRGSLSRSQAPGATNSPQLGTGGASSDRILSWRQGIEHGGERRASGLMLQGSIGTPTRSERSLSPTKAARAPLSPTGANLASDARKLQYHGSSPMAGNRLGTPVTSPTASVFSHTPERIPTRLTEEKEKPEKKKLELEKNKSKEDGEVESPPPLPTPSFTFRPADEEDDDLRLDPAGASYSFWNLNRWKSIAGFRGSLLGNSGNQEQPSGHSRSPSKSRKEGDEEDKEKEGRKSMNLDKLGGRRQSMGVFTSVTSAASTADEGGKKKKKDKDEGEKRRSQPGSSLFGRQDRKMSASDETTIPTIINTRPSEDRHGRGPYEEIDEADGDEVGASRKIDTILSPSAMAKTGLGSSNRESSPYGVAAGAGGGGGGGESSPWSRGGSYASKISSELSSEIEERREEEAAAEEEEEEVMKCTKCGSASFKAKKIAGRQRLSCRRCGLLVGE